MAQIREIRQRIRTVQSVAKITNALQLVAASRMRRAQQNALAARPYEERLRYVLGNLAGVASGEDVGEVFPLLQQRAGDRTTLIYFSSNRGLSGGLPGNLNRRAAAFLLDQPGEVQVITVGRKGRDFIARTGRPIIAEFNELGDYPSLSDTLGIARVATDEFIEGRTDRVFVLFADFVNTASQRPTIQQVLPIQPPRRDEDQAGPQIEYIFEPDPGDVLNALLPRYVEMVLYHAALEAAASDQSARFVAMKNATDAANDLIESLRLTYNKARQEQITRELLDIIGGVAALEG